MSRSLLRFIKSRYFLSFLKKKLLLSQLFSWIFLSESAFANSKSFEIRLGYAQFIDKNVQKLYGPGAPDVEIEGTFSFLSGLSLWGNLNCVWQTGTSLGLEDHTKMSMKTASAGFKMLFFEHCSCCHPYLGLGVLGTYFWVEDYIDNKYEQEDRWGSAAVGKLGVHFFFKDAKVFLDPFLDYYYQPLGNGRDALLVSDDKVNVGGFRTGLGLGCRF